MRLLVLVASAAMAIAAAEPSAQAPQRGAPPGGAPAAQAAAPIDLTGYWVSIVNEDWRWRMVTPPKGDYASVPMSADGRAVADKWTPAMDGRCEAYGAAGLMRMPTRVHITWQDDSTLKIDTDAGAQTRLLHFGAGAPPPARSLQGYSVATWEIAGGRGAGGGGRGAPPAAGAAAAGAPPTPAPGAGPGGAAAAADGRGGRAAGGAGRGAPVARFGSLKVVTTNLSEGWLRRNGVPYSESTTLTEHFDRFKAPNGDEWFFVTTIVNDPKYLAQEFVTSSHFRKEPDGAKFSPAPCKTS